MSDRRTAPSRLPERRAGAHGAASGTPSLSAALHGPHAARQCTQSQLPLARAKTVRDNGPRASVGRRKRTLPSITRGNMRWNKHAVGVHAIIRVWVPGKKKI